jgi:hypothetical protein
MDETVEVGSVETPYTHHLVVHLDTGGWVTLGTHKPHYSNDEVAIDWANRIRKDVSLYGTVVAAGYDLALIGNPVVIPARSVRLIEVCTPPPAVEPPEPGAGGLLG